jgi:hypothetical protein
MGVNPIITMTDDVICPYCLREDDNKCDSYLREREWKSVICVHCRQVYFCKKHVTVRYSTTKEK